MPSCGVLMHYGHYLSIIYFGLVENWRGFHRWDGLSSNSLDNTMKDFVRRGRSKSVVDSSVAPSAHSLTSPRKFSLPMVRLPLGTSLRRHDAIEPPAHTKPPLLTLKLSSRSFLDSTIGDGTLRGPLYEIKTVGTVTTILMYDDKRISVQAASIKWPRMLPTKTVGKGYTDGVQIQLRGARYLGGETLLKPAANPK
jgi:hypothetical protein